MSFLGSPYSNSFNFEYDDERYAYEDDNEIEDLRDESDEDTEDASETDNGRMEEPLEIKEQMYQDKLASLKKKLQQLKEGSHHEFNRKVKKLENLYNERLRINELYKDYRIDCIEREYNQERKTATKEYDDKMIDLRENLISDLEDKKRTIEAERHSIELSGDSMEVKPIMTRKLRRRPNDPIPVPEKRRKAPTAQIVYLLDDKEVDADLKCIHRGNKIGTTPVRKLSESNSTSPGAIQNPLYNNSNLNDNQTTMIETRVEDGKLLYEKRWFHRGQSIFVESRDLQKYAANISAIATDHIMVKKSDGNKCRIYVAHLARGKISIKRRAS